ncbi:MAG: hypothetical protein ACMUJM_06395 [bacterium]
MERNKGLLSLKASDFANLFGASEKEILTHCGEMISGMDFVYRTLGRQERDTLILKVLRYIYSKELTPAGQERLSEWEKGWDENFQQFVASGYDVDTLVPKYYKKDVPVRLCRDFVQPINDDFVLHVTKVFRCWIFKKYLQNVASIYEFGCGPAHHLAFLTTIFPEKKLIGLDWTNASQKIINLLAQHNGWPIRYEYFNFFHPDTNLHMEPNSAVFTFGALEQIGGNHGPFLEFLLEKVPELCVHIEGIHELYNEDYLLDYLALKYHTRRNYLNGFLTRLRQLEKEERIEIIKVHHQQFGNLFDDPHSYVIWKVKK